MKTDAELIGAYRFAGDRPALEALFSRHAAGAYRVAWRILRDATHAEDAVQEAVLEAVEGLESLRAPGAFKGWFFRIVANNAITVKRRTGYEQRMGRFVAQEAVMTDGPAEGADPETLLKIGEAMQILPEKYRTPLLLHHYEHLSYEEVAESVGCTRAAVGVRVHRGLKRLRAMLATAGAVVTVASLARFLEAGERVAVPPRFEALISETVAKSLASRTVPVASGAIVGGTVAGLGAMTILKYAVAAAVLLAAGVFAVDLFRGDPHEREMKRPVVREASKPEVPKATEDPQAGRPAHSVPAGAGATLPAGGLHGRVLDPTGRPVSGVRVTLHPSFMLAGTDPFETNTLAADAVSSVVPPPVRGTTPEFSEWNLELSLGPVPTDAEGKLSLDLGSSLSPVLTDAEGRYRWSWKDDAAFFASATVYRVVALHSRFALSSVRVEDVDPACSTQVPDIRLAAGATISGNVVDKSGNAIRDVSILLEREKIPNWAAEAFPRDGITTQMMDDGGSKVVAGGADGTGRFEISRVPPGQIRLKAYAPGYLVSETSILVRDGEYRNGLVLRLEKGKTVSGIVRERGGSPVGGAKVGSSIIVDGFDDPGPSAHTRLDGSFEISGLSEGPCVLEVQAMGFRGTKVNVDTNRSFSEIVLDRAMVVRGRVIVRETGLPPEEFKATMDREDEEGSAVEYLEYEKGPAGTFTLPIDRADGEQIRLVISSSGFAPSRLGPYEMRTAGVVDVGTVSLDHGAAIRGLIVRQDGMPVAGASVDVLPSPGGDDVASVNDEPFLSDKDGRFAATCLSPGTYFLRVSQDAHPVQSHGPIDVPPAGVDEVRVVLNSGGRVRGVIDPSVGGQAAIYVVPEGRQEEGDGDSTWVNRDGTFVSPYLLPGRYRLTLEITKNIIDSRVLARDEVEIVAGSEVVWNYRAGEKDLPVRIEGMAYGWEGRPMSDASLLLWCEGSDFPEITRTDDLGRFTLDSVTPGIAYVLLLRLNSAENSGAEENGCIPFVRVEIVKGKLLELRPPRCEASLSGVLRDARGNICAGAKLALQPGEGPDMKFQVSDTKTQLDGRFRFDRLPAGRYRIVDCNNDLNKVTLTTVTVADQQFLDLGVVTKP